MCLLLKEFRANMKRVIGTTCHRGQIFPLSLPLLFLLLFGENHPLSGRNHHALVDAQQLTTLYMDLCKPPGKPVYWEESGVKMPGPWKRQRSVEYFPSMGPNKKAKAPWDNSGLRLWCLSNPFLFVRSLVGLDQLLLSMSGGGFWWQNWPIVLSFFFFFLYFTPTTILLNVRSEAEMNS